MAEGPQQVYDVDRLGQVLHGAQLDRIDRRGDAGVAGEDHDATGGIDFEQRGISVSPEAPSRFRSSTTQSGGLPRPCRARSGTLFAASDRIAAALQGPHQRRAERVVVLDDQHALVHGIPRCSVFMFRPRSAIGSSMLARPPPPADCPARCARPALSTAENASSKPMPAPPLRAGSGCATGLAQHVGGETRGRRRRSRSPASPDRPISVMPISGAASAALLSRFTKACSSVARIANSRCDAVPSSVTRRLTACGRIACQRARTPAARHPHPAPGAHPAAGRRCVPPCR
jgi:hypothetical protein